MRKIWDGFLYGMGATVAFHLVGFLITLGVGLAFVLISSLLGNPDPSGYM